MNDRHPSGDPHPPAPDAGYASYASYDQQSVQYGDGQPAYGLPSQGGYAPYDAYATGSVATAVTGFSPDDGYLTGHTATTAFPADQFATGSFAPGAFAGAADYDADPLFGDLPGTASGTDPYSTGTAAYGTAQWAGVDTHAPLGTDSYGARQELRQHPSYDQAYDTGGSSACDTSGSWDTGWDATGWSGAAGSWDTGPYAAQTPQPYASPDHDGYGGYEGLPAGYDTTGYDTTDHLLGGYDTGGFQTTAFEQPHADGADGYGHAPNDGYAPAEGHASAEGHSLEGYEPDAYQSGHQAGYGAGHPASREDDAPPADAADAYTDTYADAHDGTYTDTYADAHENPHAHQQEHAPAPVDAHDHAHGDAPDAYDAHDGDPAVPAEEDEDRGRRPVTVVRRAPGRGAPGRGGPGSRRRSPAKRSALLTVAVPSVAVIGVAGVAAASVGSMGGDDKRTTTASHDVKPAAANNKLDTQLDNLSADTRDFADRASRTQERIDLKEKKEAERRKKAEEAARRERLRPKFALPVAQHGLSATFGQSGVNWMSVHTGIDFPVAPGTQVMAATDGTVRFQFNTAYGNMAIVTAKDGTETWYCHLSSYRLNSGTAVKAGDVIAFSGNSGNTTGPHLHFEVRPNGGGAIDPLPWLRSHGLDPT